MGKALAVANAEDSNREGVISGHEREFSDAYSKMEIMRKYRF